MNTMLKFFKRSATTQQTAASTRVRWSENIVNYNCESTSAWTCEKRSKQEKQKQNNARRRYRNELEAITSDREKIHDELTRHYCTLVSEISCFYMSKMSVHEMEATLDNLIDELDKIREVDPDTGILYESEQFISLEKRFKLLLEMSECETRRVYVKSLLSTETAKNVANDRICFSMLFKK